MALPLGGVGVLAGGETVTATVAVLEFSLHACPVTLTVADPEKLVDQLIEALLPFPVMVPAVVGVTDQV